MKEKTYFTRKNLVVIALSFFCAVVVLFTGLCIEGSHSITNKNNPSLWGIKLRLEHEIKVEDSLGKTMIIAKDGVIPLINKLKIIPGVIDIERSIG